MLITDALNKSLKLSQSKYPPVNVGPSSFGNLRERVAETVAVATGRAGNLFNKIAKYAANLK